jgi:hypothetical protein
MAVFTTTRMCSTRRKAALRPQSAGTHQRDTRYRASRAEAILTPTADGRWRGLQTASPRTTAWLKW